MNITNKATRPISIPLPGGKKLFLGPGKTGQITAKAAEHPPLLKLVESGDLEIDDSTRQRGAASSDSAAAPNEAPASSQKSNIRRTGDR